MNGIPLKSGVNDCEWNWIGLCTNPTITGGQTENDKHDWNSQQNCPYTIFGARKCSGYELDHQLVWRKEDAK